VQSANAAAYDSATVAAGGRRAAGPASAAPSGTVAFTDLISARRSGGLHTKFIRPSSGRRTLARMSDFTTRTVVRCPFDQAEHRLSQYFRSHGDAYGEVAILSLGLDVPWRPVAAERRVEFERRVIATFTPIRLRRKVTCYAVLWTLQGASCPNFVGSLAIEPSGSRDSFSLGLTGDYDVPFGDARVAFDAVVGRRFAKLAIALLLLRISEDIELQWETDERAVRGSSAVERRRMRLGKLASQSNAS
jgi:hypothetical protein